MCVTILDFSQPFVLPPHESEAARVIFYGLIHQYRTEQTSPREYDRIALIQATFDHVASEDTFFILFFLFVYEILVVRETGVVFDISLHLNYFNDLALWNSAKLSDVNSGIEVFAEFIVENLLLLCMAYYFGFA